MKWSHLTEVHVVTPLEPGVRILVRVVARSRLSFHFLRLISHLEPGCAAQEMLVLRSGSCRFVEHPINHLRLLQGHLSLASFSICELRPLLVVAWAEESF